MSTRFKGGTIPERKLFELNEQINEEFKDRDISLRDVYLQLLITKKKASSARGWAIFVGVFVILLITLPLWLEGGNISILLNI